MTEDSGVGEVRFAPGSQTPAGRTPQLAYHPGGNGLTIVISNITPIVW
jgi:hypothetical protein